MAGALLLLVLAASFVVVRIGAVAFGLTGMPWEHAKFQALSDFTNAGFTTRESEEVVGHPIRRNIASFLMIGGNAGLLRLGEVRCWVDGSWGQLAVPQGRFFAIGAGPQRTCAIRYDDGELVCWGERGTGTGWGEPVGVVFRHVGVGPRMRAACARPTVMCSVGAPTNREP